MSIVISIRRETYDTRQRGVTNPPLWHLGTILNYTHLHKHTHLRKYAYLYLGYAHKEVDECAVTSERSVFS